ncbi:alpha/beta hydrolase [Bacteroidales bacterium OttesenSCG-928-K03]|nr:alpha/beta hydrolase [Bacteroidales bacterium OttesenSCG-928-K22]MDL2242567.1 alpha/beta hydrolase [Bacteroidales bacterium OttesenSCG-928-K03]
MKTIKIISIVILSVITTLGITLCLYFYRNMNYDKNTDKTISRAGFVEKQVVLADGTILNYGEGKNNGIPLMLIHGQGVNWKNYIEVLPELSKYYHVFAIDCHGHGKSSKNKEKYTAEKMGDDFVWFIENVIGQPAVVSGHSSGGLLTAWLASNSPENVIGIVIEDAPFFATEVQRCRKTFAWLDQFQVIHNFLNQTNELNYIRYYLENCYLQTFFGDSWANIKKYAFNYIEKNPNENLRIFFLPPEMNKAFDLLSGEYDLCFGDTFYDCSWFENFDQTDVLSKIKCPSVLIHTNWSYNNEGILLGAMDGNDALNAHELLQSNKLIKINSGHNSHDEKPKEFNKILIEFLDVIR